MSDPTRCKHPACGAWTFRPNGYCSDSCAGTSTVTAESLRGIGIVTPPSVAHASKRTRVRRNSGYIAANGAWIATAEAPYGEISRDVAESERVQRAYNDRVARDSRKPYVTTGQNGKRKRITPSTLPAPTRRITAADLAPIGDANH